MNGNEVCSLSEWGIVLEWWCSSRACFFWRVLHACLPLLYYYEDLIIVSVESGCEERGLMWWAWISVCLMVVSICHVYTITNGPSGNSPLKYIGNQWFCSARESFVMVLLWGTGGLVWEVAIWKGVLDAIILVLNPSNIELDPTNIDLD